MEISFKNFILMEYLYICGIKFTVMIHLISDEGCFFDLNDSKQYIELKINESFDSIDEFINCKTILFSSYWGDCVLLGSEEEYEKWIINLASKILLKH